MKFTTLLSVLALFSTVAASAAAPVLEVSFDCAPVKALDSPMRIGWDSLLEVQSLVSVFRQHADGKMEQYTDIKSKMFSSFDKKEAVVTDRYSVNERGDLLTPSSDRLNLPYQAVVFTQTKLDIPFSPGPVPPGDYPATATLTLVSTYRKNPGDDVSVDSRQIELSCRYKVSYGRGW